MWAFMRYLTTNNHYQEQIFLFQFNTGRYPVPPTGIRVTSCFLLDKDPILHNPLSFHSPCQVFASPIQGCARKLKLVWRKLAQAYRSAFKIQLEDRLKSISMDGNFLQWGIRMLLSSLWSAVPRSLLDYTSFSTANNPPKHFKKKNKYKNLGKPQEYAQPEQE